MNSNQGLKPVQQVLDKVLQALSNSPLNHEEKYNSHPRKMRIQTQWLQRPWSSHHTVSTEKNKIQCSRCPEYYKLHNKHCQVDTLKVSGSVTSSQKTLSSTLRPAAQALESDFIHYGDSHWEKGCFSFSKARVGFNAKLLRWISNTIPPLQGYLRSITEIESSVSQNLPPELVSS